MPAVFDPSQPFEVVEGETLDSLIAPRPRAPIAPPAVATAPAAPVFDPAKPFTPVADAPPAPIGPVFDPSAPLIKVYGVEEFAAKSVDELLADKDFMPVQFGLQNKAALLADPALQSKAEQVYEARERAGTSLWSKAKAAWTGAAPAAEMLWSGVTRAAKTGFKLGVGGSFQAGKALVGSQEEKAAFVKDMSKTGAELASSVELAALGSTDLIRRSARELSEVPRAVRGALPAVAQAQLAAIGAKPKSEMTEGDWRNRYFDDVEAAEKTEAAGRGSAEVAKMIGLDAETLKRDYDIDLDPTIIAEMSIGSDPLNYVPMGAAVGVVGKVGGKMFTAAVAVTRTAKQAEQLAKIWNTATAAASGGAAKVAGATAKGVGGVVEKIGAVADKGVRSLGGTGAGVGLGGLLGGDVYSALGGAAIAKGVPRITQAIGRTISGAGKILTGEAVAPAALTLAGETVRGAVSGAVKGAAEGGLLILPFEIGARPEEEEQLLGMVGLGAGIRAGAEGIQPGARAAGKAAQNKLAESIFQRVEQEPLSESPPYGDPLLDSTHSANVSKLSPSEQKLVNWGRELLRGAGGEVYVLDAHTFNRETGSKTAHGYAVNVGEKIHSDGSSTPVFRIFLNQSAEAMPHEFFHALTDLDPKRASDFRDTVKASLTSDQLKSFEQLYNFRLNNGLPEVQWKKRLSPEQVANEAAAETFSRLFLAQDLTGVAPKVQQKAALFVSSLLEKLGAPLGKVGAKPGEAGVSTLGVRPGAKLTKVGQAWIANMLQRVNDEGTLGQPPIAPERPVNQTLIPSEVVRAKPAKVKPTSAAPVPTPPPTVPPVNPPLPVVPSPAAPTGKRNIRAARQDDFAGRRREITQVEAAKSAAEATGDAGIIARVNEIAALIEAGSTVVEIEHRGAKAAGTAEAPSGRTARRAEQDATYIAEGLAATPKAIREAYQKTLVIYEMAVVGNNIQALGMSLDKVIANAHKVVKESAARGVEAKIPYEVTDGRLTDNAWGQFVDDLKSYAENQSNGYRGDGQKLTRPTTDVGLSIPAENPAYNPRPITEERANFINMVQGLNPPLTAREGRQSSAVVPGNVKGQILAEANLRTPERPSVIRPEDITKQDFKSQPGRSIAETNPLRNELAAAGVPVRELIEVTERINARDINSVRPRPELDFKAPVTDTIRGGFLPGRTPDDESPGGFNDPRPEPEQAPKKEEFLPPSQTFEPPSGTFEPPRKFGGGEFLVGDTASAIAEVLKMDAAAFNAAAKSWEGGQRNRAYDLGLSTKSIEEVQLLKDAQEAASADRKRFMAAKDIDNGVASALKAQFFREAYEAATDTGGAAGEIGWRQAFPDREAPFPEAKPAGQFLPSAEELNKVKSGEKDGETFNRDGTIFSPGDRKLDVVTLASENLPASELSPERVQAFLSKYPALLESDSVKPGIFRLANGDISIDLNVVVDQSHRTNTEAFARDNNQQAIFDLVSFESVETGGSGQTVLTTPESIADAAKKLERGESVKVSGEPSGDFLPRREKPMPGSIEEYDARVPRKEVFPKTNKSVKPSKQSTVNPTAWILPDGEVHPISTLYHEEDLAANSVDYNKRFGTKFRLKDISDDVRTDALSKGFVRMRYAPENGRMAVEVGARHWTKQKAKVLDTLLSHSGKIDTLAINLIDGGGQAVDSVADKVFNADDKAVAITDLVNEIMPPKVTRAKGVGPSDIQRMRALPGPGDFLPADNFSSKADPITNAAIETKSGKIYSGTWHGEAMDKWAEAERGGGDPQDLKRDGFLTASGKFLDRKEALAHAESIGQLRPGSDSSERGSLESDTFHKDLVRQVIDDMRAKGSQLRRKSPQNELAFPMGPGDIQKRK